MKPIIHECRVNTTEAEGILSGDKSYVVIQNGFYIQKGDQIKFIVYKDNLGRLNEDHPISNYIYEITYASTDPGIERNYVIVGIRRMTNEQG